MGDWSTWADGEGKGFVQMPTWTQVQPSPLKPDIIEKTDTDSSWLRTVKQEAAVTLQQDKPLLEMEKKPKHFHSGVVKHWNCWENLQNLHPWRYLTYLDKAQETWSNFEVGFALSRGLTALQRFLPTYIALLFLWTLIKMNWFKWKIKIFLLRFTKLHE